MTNVVGVRFKKAGKIYYFDPDGHEIVADDHVIVETARGLEYGSVVVSPHDVSDDQIVAPLKKVIRKATERDLEQVAANEAREAEALEMCAKKVAAHNLDMRLIDAEFTFDNSKIIFYFTADGRVDFRELVKDLASVFRTRIELRQIGVRDEAKIIGGLGACGREFCCKAFLGDFQPVSIKMAKEQNLSLNPTKISGVCGRLMCCLRFECESRDGDTRIPAPEIGARAVTVEGEGKIVAVNATTPNTLSVKLDSGQIMEFPVEEVDIKRCSCPKAPVCMSCEPAEAAESIEAEEPAAEDERRPAPAPAPAVERQMPERAREMPVKAESPDKPSEEKPQE